MNPIIFGSLIRQDAEKFSHGALVSEMPEILQDFALRIRKVFLSSDCLDRAQRIEEAVRQIRAKRGSYLLFEEQMHQIAMLFRRFTQTVEAPKKSDDLEQAMNDPELFGILLETSDSLNGPQMRKLIKTAICEDRSDPLTQMLHASVFKDLTLADLEILGEFAKEVGKASAQQVIEVVAKKRFTTEPVYESDRGKAEIESLNPARALEAAMENLRFDEFMSICEDLGPGQMGGEEFSSLIALTDQMGEGGPGYRDVLQAVRDKVLGVSNRGCSMDNKIRFLIDGGATREELEAISRTGGITDIDGLVKYAYSVGRAHLATALIRIKMQENIGLS
jgi:hypothetical protein